MVPRGGKYLDRFETDGLEAVFGRLDGMKSWKRVSEGLAGVARHGREFVRVGEAFTKERKSSAALIEGAMLRKWRRENRVELTRGATVEERLCNARVEAAQRCSIGRRQRLGQVERSPVAVEAGERGQRTVSGRVFVVVACSGCNVMDATCGR